MVDSVKYIDYKGILLKTVFSKVLKTKNSYFGWCKWGDTVNIYSEKIGTPNFGLLPQCLYNCLSTSGEDICPQVENLLCYNDSGISIKYYDTCLGATWVPSSLDEKKLAFQKLNLYPNPTIDKITLGFEAINFQTKVIIVDVMGKKVLEKDFSKYSTLSIDVAELKSGIYFLKLLKDGETTVGSGSFVKL